MMARYGTVLDASSRALGLLISPVSLPVLARPELKIHKGLRQQVLQLIRRYSQTVTPSRPLQITPDPDDNIFLE